VAACPTEALALPAPAPWVRAQPHAPRRWLLACDRAVVENAAGSAGRIPCLYALAPGWLWRQAQAQDAEAIVATTGDCAQCPRGMGSAGWRQQWSKLAQPGSTAKPPALQFVEPRAWQAMAAPARDLQAPARRAFFRRLATPMPANRHADALADQPASATLSSARAWLVERLANAREPASPQPAPLWSVELDAARCSGCLSCARLCPTPALRVEPAADSGGPEHLVLDMARCIGCTMCQAVCDDGALGPVRRSDEAAVGAGHQPRRLPLQRWRCGACGVTFPVLANVAATPPAPPRCRACESGRPLQHNRVVQTGLVT
jgi:Pyruvate/2-oxoacid:ferredoxin oxidoreductase delta subunit